MNPIDDASDNVTSATAEDPAPASDPVPKSAAEQPSEPITGQPMSDLKTEILAEAKTLAEDAALAAAQAVIDDVKAGMLKHEDIVRIAEDAAKAAVEAAVGSVLSDLKSGAASVLGDNGIVDHLKGWMRKELGLHASGLTEEERAATNP